MKYLLGLCCLFYATLLVAQPEPSEQAEEEIFMVVEQMPRFPGCTDSTKTAKELKDCSDQKMLEFIYGNINYPEVDRVKGNEGTAVIRFVVEVDGSISNASILRDPGEQLGTEALRVVNLMNEMPEKWTPGVQRGVPVRVFFNLPVKFKLETVTEPDFVVSGRDSIWIRFDTPAQFEGGEAAFVQYIEEELRFPEAGQDSCQIGIVELNTLIGQDGSLKILDVVDYNALGIDYQFEAIRIINASAKKWTAAEAGGRAVNTNKSMRILFRPNMVSCGSAISDFEQAEQFINEGTALLEAEKMEEGIAKLTEAINLFPNNGEYLSLRGQAFISMQRTEEACIDLKKAKDILVVSWYDGLIPILCK